MGQGNVTGRDDLKETDDTNKRMTKQRLNIQIYKVKKMINTRVRMMDKAVQCDTEKEVKHYLDVGHVLIKHMGLSYIMRMG